MRNWGRARAAAFSRAIAAHTTPLHLLLLLSTPLPQIIFPQRTGNGTSLRGVCALLCGRFHYGVAGGRRFLQRTEYI